MAALFTGAALIVFFHTLPEPQRANMGRFDFIAPPQQMRHFHLGYSENIADSMWLRVVQDLHICERVPGGVPHTEERAKLKEQGLLPDEPACKKGWVFRMLDFITEIAPRFRMPYVAGATSLSILVDDREGATAIFEKGMKQFPEDWSLAYRAAYHYLYEVKDNEKAAKAMLIAAQNGGPPWLFALAGKIFSEQGRAQIAKDVLEDALSRNPKGFGVERVKQRLREINRILGLPEDHRNRSSTEQ